MLAVLTSRSVARRRKEVFQGSCDAVSPWLVADIAVLLADGLLDGWNRVIWSRHTSGKLARKHREIVQMIACRKNEITGDAELSGNLRQCGSFVVSDVAESRVDIIPNHGEIRD